jgi:hypothetical protein
VFSETAIKLAGIENRTNWPKIGEIAVTEVGAPLGVGPSAREAVAAAHSRLIAMNFVSDDVIGGRRLRYLRQVHTRKPCWQRPHQTP